MSLDTLHEFAFDCTLRCAIRVKAASEEEARRLLDGIDANEANLGAWPNGDPILCEVSMAEGASLYEIDGENVQ